jgi:nucleotide-binding universal stress UspA family protein
MAAERHLLVPLAGTSELEHAIATACALAAEDGSVTGVVVIEVSPLLPLDARMDNEESSARAVLARARSVADACGVRFVPRIVRARGAAAAILELAEEEDAEIVLVDADGHGLPRSERQLLRKAPDRVRVIAA